MKIRTNFVSNSSSSSFICQICYKAYNGFDDDLTDLGLIECENDHMFCQRHLLKQDDHTEFCINNGIQVFIDYCPICQMKTFIKSDILTYLEKKIDLFEIETEIRSKFKTYKDFKRYLCNENS